MTKHFTLYSQKLYHAIINTKLYMIICFSRIFSFSYSKIVNLKLRRTIKFSLGYVTIFIEVELANLEDD